jgi:hypothetical protein
LYEKIVETHQPHNRKAKATCMIKEVVEGMKEEL